jgi:hypothetical protein
MEGLGEGAGGIKGLGARGGEEEGEGGKTTGKPESLPVPPKYGGLAFQRKSHAQWIISHANERSEKRIPAGWRGFLGC